MVSLGEGNILRSLISDISVPNQAKHQIHALRILSFSGEAYLCRKVLSAHNLSKHVDHLQKSSRGNQRGQLENLMRRANFFLRINLAR